MNRRKIYFVIVAFVILIIFYKADTANSFKHEPQPSPITKDEILADFKSTESKNINSNNAQTKYLFFPTGYSGNQGDLFYVGKTEGDTICTEKYFLTKTEKDGELTYVLKDTWQNFLLPPEKFETYKLHNFRWIKTD